MNLEFSLEQLRLEKDAQQQELETAVLKLAAEVQGLEAQGLELRTSLEQLQTEKEAQQEELTSMLQRTAEDADMAARENTTTAEAVQQQHARALQDLALQATATAEANVAQVEELKNEHWNEILSLKTAHDEREEEMKVTILQLLAYLLDFNME